MFQFVQKTNKIGQHVGSPLFSLKKIWLPYPYVTSLKRDENVLCWPHPENVMWKIFPHFPFFSTFFFCFSSFHFHHDKKVCRKWSLIGFVHTAALWIDGGSENLWLKNLIKIYFLPLCFQFNWLLIFFVISEFYALRMNRVVMSCELLRMGDLRNLCGYICYLVKDRPKPKLNMVVPTHCLG